jgi:hypothetical protein
MSKTTSRRKWAKCCECGGEVWFDAWADLEGDIAGGPYDNNKCSECEEEDVDYVEVEEDDE